MTDKERDWMNGRGDRLRKALAERASTMTPEEVARLLDSLESAAPLFITVHGDPIALNDDEERRLSALLIKAGFTQAHLSGDFSGNSRVGLVLNGRGLRVQRGSEMLVDLPSIRL